MLQLTHTHFFTNIPDRHPVLDTGASERRITNRLDYQVKTGNDEKVNAGQMLQYSKP